MCVCVYWGNKKRVFEVFANQSGIYISIKRYAYIDKLRIILSRMSAIFVEVNDHVYIPHDINYSVIRCTYKKTKKRLVTEG